MWRLCRHDLRKKNFALEKYLIKFSNITKRKYQLIISVLVSNCSFIWVSEIYYFILMFLYKYDVKIVNFSNLHLLPISKSKSKPTHTCIMYSYSFQHIWNFTIIGNTYVYSYVHTRRHTQSFINKILLEKVKIIKLNLK